MKYLDPKADLTFKRVFGELPKFTPHTYTEKKTQVLWLRYLTEIDEKTRMAPDDPRADPTISKALTILEESAFTDEELARYEGFWDMVSVERTLYYSGWRKGYAEGYAENLAEGKAEGRAETLLEIAAKLKHLNTPIDTIAQLTGLSI